MLRKHYRDAVKVFYLRFFPIALLILSVCNSAYSQNADNEIKGRWIFSGIVDSENQVFECLDMLLFNKDNSYSILNDCYGKDIEAPIIEKGTWIFNKKREEVLLKNRERFSNYIFHDYSTELILQVKQITNREMKICFSRKKNCIPEIYKKL